MPSDKTQKNLSGLHNTLETMGYSVPNIDQFAKDMRKEENLRSVYDKVSSGGYELPDFETFKADMGWIKPTPAGVPTPLRPKDQLAPTGKPDAPATPFGFDLPENPKKPSHAPKARLGFPRLDKKMRPVQEVNDPSVPLLKTTRDVAQDENGNVVNVVQPELVPDFDPNNGGVTAPKALMDVTTGKTIRPTELSKEEVEGYNAGNIDAVKDSKLRQALKEANIIYTPTLTENDARRKAGELTSEIDKALAERTEYLDKKAGDVTIADSPTAWGIRGFNIPAAANKSRIEQATDSEYMMLEAARSTMHDVNNLIAEADHNTKEGGDLASVYERSALAGTLRGFGSTIIDPRVWDQGARDLSASSRLALALDKADRGEKLTRGEQLLLDAKANEMATALYFEDRIGRGYKAGSVTAHAIPFMVEMAMSGGISTMGKNVSSGLARYAMRRFGAKAAGKAIIKRTIRGAATTAGAMLAGGAMANTFGAMKTAANVVGRTTGDVQFATGVDAEGRATTTYGGHTEGDNLGEAFAKGELSSTAEYATELLGDGLVDAVKWAAGKAASPVASKLAQLIGKTGAEAAEQVGKKSVLGKVVGSVGDAGVWTLSKASKFIENMQASKFATSLKALEKQAQWNGVFGEYLEELANNAAAVMIGDKDLSADKGKGFFNLDDNIDTFLGVSLMGGVMSGAQTAGYFAGGGARGMARYQIGQSEGAVWSTLTTDEQRKAWDDVRRQILLQDGKEQVDAVKSALTNPNFNAEQRRAILDYTKSVQTYKGMSEYRRKQSEDTKADPLQNELADSYDKGAGMTEAEEMSHARSWYEFAQQKAAERLGVDANALDEMGTPDQLTLDQVAQLREEHNEQAVQSYVDYLNARATYEGMIGSVSQGIQAEAAQAEQAVRSQQHKDGTLRRATLRGTEGQNVEVHIKDGDLVMDEEGRIDTDKSSKDFIVRDNETGVVRFASIDDIISAEQPTSADDAVSEAVNAVYERREKEAADAINGTITPQAGAVYNLLDADGNPQQIAIQQVGQDGTLDVDYSGVPHKMTTDELQSMADNTRARQIENEHAAQVQQAKAEEREEREQAGLPRYALNDELTIRTPEGEEVTAYVTNEEDADGNIEVYFNEPFDGKKVHLFTKDYLDGVVVGTRLSPETNTSAGAVEAPATPAAPALAQAQPVSEEVPEEATTAPTPTQEEENDIIGRSMTEEEAEAFLTAISNNHEVAPELELTPENWYAEFGEDGVVHTPIGDAHMGENQFLKMMRDGRKSKLGMIRPTLEAPHAIVEEPSTAKEGQETERDSSYIYIRVFEKEDGSRHYHFTSVSVQRDGGEVIVSNQEKSRNQVKRLLTEGVVLWMRADNAPDTSDVDQDLYSSQGTELSDPASEGTDASQSTPSESKDNESTSHADPNDESLSPEEAYEAVLRAANGDAALALEVIKSTITDKEKALAKAKKAKPRSANTIDGKIQALAEVASGIEAAETSLAHWQAVAEIAAEPVAKQTEQESEEPTTEQAPAEEETAEEEEQEEGAASDPQEGEGVTTQTEEVAPEAGGTQASDATGEGYRLSAIAAKRGGNFFENSEGSIDLVKISDNVFEAIGIKPLPMRMTEAMAQHIIKQHAKELGISNQEEAVAFVVDIMQHFDHVREGNKPNTYIFSIEKGRSRTGKRAVTLVLPSKSGEYLGVSSSGYEKVSRLKERALLWEEGANNEAPTTETASANVTSPSATQGGMTGGSASNQSNALSQGKDSEKDTAEGEANDGNQDDLSIEEKEALLSKAKQELVEKEEERTAVAEQAIAVMKDYYDSGAIPGMDSGEFHGQATLILIGFKDRSNLELMKAPGLSELLPSLYKLADEARAKKMLVRKYEKELSQAKEVEGETLTYDKAIRDELVNTMRDAGIEVVTDEAEGQAVLDAARAGEAQMQRAYHGTDADFEAFDHSHMGEGAGGQAYGWGSYFTEEEGVARSYAGGGFVYEAELPDDTGSNYLHFESKPSNKDIARVKRELVKYILRKDEEGMYDYPQGKDDLTQEVDDAGEPTTWRDLYGTVSSHLGSDKEASAFFHSIGYVGIQYNSSETDGGKKNLVIFDESDISIQSKVRLFKTSSGEVYGFVKDGKIYLDLKHATAETAIHEYTHLWASALRRVNPRAWKSIRKQLKGFELWADIASRYPELKGDEDALADEVLAQYSGKRGAQRIEEEMKKAENATDLVGKARVLAAFNSLKEALKTFWTEVADFFGMDYYKSVEDAADKAMSDLLRGVNPNAVEAKKEATKKKPTKKATAKKETATSSVIAPDSERYNGYIVTLPKSGKAGAEVGNIEEFVGADEMREGLMVVYQAPEGFAVASNGTMAIADKTQFDVYKKGKAYKLDGTTIDAGAWKPLKDQWQSFVSTETRGEHSDPFTESPVKIPRLSKYLDRVEQDLYNRWKYAKSEGLTKESFKTYRSRALVVIPNGRGGYVEYRYPEMRSMTLAAKRLGVTSFFVEGDHHYEYSVYPGVRLVGNGRLGSVVHAGYIFRHDAPNPNESELSYLYDESVGVKDTDEGVRMQKGDEVLSLQETSDAINARFNEELKEQIEGTLPKGHIYSLGMPSNALRSAGVPNLPIELTARRLATKASQEYHSEHPFELSDIQNLPQAIAHPIAVFDSSTRSDSTVVLTELQDSRGVNFVVALRVVKSSASRSLEIDVNGIRSIYPKDRVTSILKWITSGKMLWVDKKKALSWITTQLPNAGYDSNATESLQDSEGRLDKQRSNSADVIKPKLQASDGEANKQRSNSAEVISHPQEDGLSKTKIAQQRTNLADVDYLDLDNVTKVVETFENPPLASEDLEISNDNQASKDNDEVRFRSSRLSPELQTIKDQAKADGIFMKAPNGRPTNLTEKQWLQVRTPEFKEWFGDWENDPTNASKVVDENGEPMVVYHGSRNRLTYFSKSFAGRNNPDVDVSRLGFFFTDDVEEAKYHTGKTTNDGYERDGDTPQVYSTFLNLRDPYEVATGEDATYYIDNNTQVLSAEDGGYDGVIVQGGSNVVYLVFEPNNIKSATENSGSFDGMNDDIRYRYTEREDGSVLSENALEAEELGKFPAAKFRKVYGVSISDFEMLKSIGLIVHSEWHHTGKSFKQTDYYSWADNAYLDNGYLGRSSMMENGNYEYDIDGESHLIDEPENETRGQSLASWYKEHKSELKKLAQEFKAREWSWEDSRRPMYDFSPVSEYNYSQHLAEAHFTGREELEMNDTADLYHIFYNDLVGGQEGLTSEQREAYRTEAKAKERAFIEEHKTEIEAHNAEMLEKREAETNRIVESNLSKQDGKESTLLKVADLAGIAFDEAYGEALRSSVEGQRNATRLRYGRIVEQEEYDMQDLEEVATSMAEALGEDVRVIHDTAEIEGRNESETNRMRGAKGWYDPKTGQVVVVLPNAESAEDLEATILHEVVGHKGLQELVGKDQFGKFLDEVFEGANEAVRNGIVERSKRYGWNTRLATEEYIAELAEQGFKDLEARDLWNVVRNAFYNLLSRVKLALGWDISDRELRYMLWRTYQMKKGEGLMGQSKDIAMQEKLGVGNYEEARFRQGESAAPVKVAATYDALIKKSSYQTQEALQDSMLSLKKVMEMIMQAKGDAKYIEEIEGYQNAYMGENRVSSVNQAEAAAYSRMALEPLVEEVSRLAKKAHHSYVTDYMMAKHGLERNRVMAFQKAVEADVDAHNKAVKESGEGEELTASSLWDAYLNDTDRLRNEADYREGRITADVWHKTDDEIRARYAPSYAEYRERDYAGLTGLLDRPDVDIQTLEEEAIEEVMKFEQENDVTDLWDLTNKATDAPLSKQYEGGLMSRETLEHVRNMYGYYIPLRGFDETTSDEAYSYLGDRDRAFSPTLKKAKGRSSKAEDPLAHIASMMESAILQSNRNKLVRQKFLNFVENNPSDLFSVQKLWVQWNNTTKTWDAVLPEFDPSDTSEEVIRKTQEFEEAMRESQRKNPELFKLASEQPSIPYRVVGKEKEMQHQIIVKRGGRDVVIIVNGDPRVAMAVNGLTNPDSDANGHVGAFFKWTSAVHRKLAGFYTSLSPNFVVKNFIRDIIYANTIAWVKESPTYAMTYHANVAKLAGQMHRLVYLYEHDKLDMSNETHRAFKLFMENGGETGYSQLRSMDRHKKEIERMMKESGGRISLKQGLRLLGDTMEFANRGIEDLSRFAAFLTSRQMGRTIDRSIYDAKEMTVNFNKKGAGSTFSKAHMQTGKGKAAAYLSGFGRSFYLFWNVAIQGSVNIARAVKRNPKKGTAYLATFLALGILQTILPALTGGDDDDRYWNLPDYVRRNNICFFVGDVLVKIPLPQEARAIFGIGELGMSYMSGKEDKDAWGVAYTMAGQLSQIMPLDLMDDSGPIHALTPSLAKPALEALTNHSWMGRPIWKDTDYNKAMPDWTKAYKSTGGVYVWLAKELNALSGGDDYKQGLINLNPAQWEYLFKGYLGGLYTAADQIIKSSETAFGDREFSMRDVPILSGFLDGADERNDMRNVNNTYYHFKEEAKEVLRLGKSYERDAEQGKGDYAKKLDELVNNKSYERALLFEDLSKEIEEMQKALKEATDPKEAEELQAEIDKQKKALVNQLRQMK